MNLGTMVAIENFGAGDILEIERPAAVDGKPGKRFMVPDPRRTDRSGTGRD
jgi:16S rRNA processing protein RimM